MLSQRGIEFYLLERHLASRKEATVHSTKIRYTVKDVVPRLTSNSLARLSPSSLVEGMMAAGLVLGPCPAKLCGICRPVSEINYQPRHS